MLQQTPNSSASPQDLAEKNRRYTQELHALNNRNTFNDEAAPDKKNPEEPEDLDGNSAANRPSSYRSNPEPPVVGGYDEPEDGENQSQSAMRSSDGGGEKGAQELIERIQLAINIGTGPLGWMRFAGMKLFKFVGLSDTIGIPGMTKGKK